MQFIQTNKKQFHKETLKLCNTDENGQPKNASLETVGCVYNRYRLVHRWVPEMVLNVQSDSLIGYIQENKTIFYDKTIKFFSSLCFINLRFIQEGSYKSKIYKEEYAELVILWYGKRIERLFSFRLLLRIGKQKAFKIVSVLF